jgi:hypothetical protein
MRSAYKIFVVKYTGKRVISIHGHDREDNIKLYLGCDVAWINLAECRDQCQACVNMVVNLWVSLRQ